MKKHKLSSCFASNGRALLAQGEGTYGCLWVTVWMGCFLMSVLLAGGKHSIITYAWADSDRESGPSSPCALTVSVCACITVLGAIMSEAVCIKYYNMKHTGTMTHFRLLRHQMCVLGFSRQSLPGQEDKPEPFCCCCSSSALSCLYSGLMVNSAQKWLLMDGWWFPNRAHSLQFNCQMSLEKLLRSISISGYTLKNTKFH